VTGVQTCALPIYEGHLRQIAFFIRQHPNKDGNSDAVGNETRFIVEAEMSALGTMQLDGLAGTRSLDLVLRTQEPLPAEWQSDLLALFEDVTSAGGLRAQLRFQATKHFPVMPREENRAASQSTNLFV